MADETKPQDNDKNADNTKPERPASIKGEPKASPVSNKPRESKTDKWAPQYGYLVCGKFRTEIRATKSNKSAIAVIAASMPDGRFKVDDSCTLAFSDGSSIKGQISGIQECGYSDHQNCHIFEVSVVK